MREMKPHSFPDEPHAILQCGDVTVHLSYTALNLMADWLWRGSHGYPFPGIATELCRAFEEVNKEAIKLWFQDYKRRKSHD